MIEKINLFNLLKYYFSQDLFKVIKLQYFEIILYKIIKIKFYHPIKYFLSFRIHIGYHEYH